MQESSAVSDQNRGPGYDAAVAGIPVTKRELICECCMRPLNATTPAEYAKPPLASGLLDYFPDALAAVAEVSRVGSLQHHPDKPMHWDKDKPADHADSLMRHFMKRGATDGDGQLHSAKTAWRALALLQLEIEAQALWDLDHPQ
jgi:hypothetical protein